MKTFKAKIVNNIFQLEIQDNDLIETLIHCSRITVFMII